MSGGTWACWPPSGKFWRRGQASGPHPRFPRRSSRSGRPCRRAARRTGFLFQQPLELNGTREARAGVARAQLRLTQAQALVQLQALVYTARLNFYTLAQAQDRLGLARDLRVIAERFDAIAREQVALGARPGIERRQTAIEAARARAQEAQASGQEQAARAALNAYLGRAPLDPIEARSEEVPRGAAGQTSPDDLVSAQRQALGARAEIAAAEATRDVPQAQARLSRAQGRPDIAPSFRISQITPTYMDAGLGVVITDSARLRHAPQSNPSAGSRPPRRMRRG